MGRPHDFCRRRRAGIVRGRVTVSSGGAFGLRADEAASILRELTDEPLFKNGVGAGGWRPVVWIAITYDDGRVVTYLCDPRFRLWHCDDPRGGGECGDRLATVRLGPVVSALIDKHRRHEPDDAPTPPLWSRASPEATHRLVGPPSRRRRRPRRDGDADE